MKRCPQCNRIATDDALSFCRADGTRLLQDSDSFSDSTTVALLPDAPVASTSGMGEPLKVPVTPTSPMDSSKATSPTRNLLGRKKRQIGVAVLAAIIVLTLADSAYHLLSPRSNATIDSLAVLPFLNVNADQQLEYLSDGMTETLICDLSQLPRLNVKARSSVFRYKDRDVAPHTVGADLNVQAVLNGRIALRGDVLTLSLELADARTENIIWSEQYSCKQTDLVSLQSEIARDVSNKLQVKLAGADEQKLAKNYTTNLVEVIRQVQAGNKRIPAEVAAQLTEYFGDDALTEREIEVLQFIAAGNRNREIAERLFISEETVKVHIKHIMEKLGASDRTQAVAIAVRRGILQL